MEFTVIQVSIIIIMFVFAFSICGFKTEGER